MGKKPFRAIICVAACLLIVSQAWLQKARADDNYLPAAVNNAIVDLSAMINAGQNNAFSARPAPSNIQYNSVLSNPQLPQNYGFQNQNLLNQNMDMEKLRSSIDMERYSSSIAQTNTIPSIPANTDNSAPQLQFEKDKAADNPGLKK